MLDFWERSRRTRCYNRVRRGTVRVPKRLTNALKGRTAVITVNDSGTRLTACGIICRSLAIHFAIKKNRKTENGKRQRFVRHFRSDRPRNPSVADAAGPVRVRRTQVDGYVTFSFSFRFTHETKRAYDRSPSAVQTQPLQGARSYTEHNIRYAVTTNPCDDACGG